MAQGEFKGLLQHLAPISRRNVLISLLLTGAVSEQSLHRTQDWLRIQRVLFRTRPCVLFAMSKLPYKGQRMASKQRRDLLEQERFYSQ
mmetsp:Transcript_41954/g.69817  ORF Transcript_41954/g.69817 Transcript_41954/m.69817 type:complete len:88 (+) Transcript_41954:170-433(+)